MSSRIAESIRCDHCEGDPFYTSVTDDVASAYACVYCNGTGVSLQKSMLEILKALGRVEKNLKVIRDK